MTSALQGWHPGEAILQERYGFTDAVRGRWMLAENFMREQHRIFHTSNLPFIPITTFDDQGRPWGGIVAGATGEIGFVTSPDTTTLNVDARLWPGDPLLRTMQRWLDSKSTPETSLMAGLGIELTTRRRNKFAGRIKGVQSHSDHGFRINLEIQETLGNCPKYINVRQFIPWPTTKPSVAFHRPVMEAAERLPKEAIDLITEADTVFIASVYRTGTSPSTKYPSHAGMNARSGLPGFTRVRPCDGRTVVLPDYSGNRFLMSLGNIESSGVVGLTIVSFTTGDVLYLTGKAQVLIGESSFNIMARQPSILLMETTGFTLVHDALPLRQTPGSEVERSPYSPKVKYLREEDPSLAGGLDGHKVRLVRAVQDADNVATLRFEATPKPGAKGLVIAPGQAVVLDFMDWIGPPTYQHMADGKPGALNDDRVRTWTVTSAHENGPTLWFELTMREMEGGVVTGALFQILRSQQPLPTVSTIADIVGVTGDFCLGQGEARHLWVAGGIGVTPFMAMFAALVKRGSEAKGDIILALASRDPDVSLKLLKRSLDGLSPSVEVRIDLFSHEESISTQEVQGPGVQLIIHKGRIPAGYWIEVASDRDVLICGPGGFGDSVQEGLRAAGVPASRVQREGFY